VLAACKQQLDAALLACKPLNDATLLSAPVWLLCVWCLYDSIVSMGLCVGVVVLHRSANSHVAGIRHIVMIPLGTSFVEPADLSS
jgi:hypothetical protein